MSKYLKIQNNGVIEVNSLSLMGASTKRGDDGKIGYFGTGNKYALSCFLRNNISVRIFAGPDEINITTKPTAIGDCDYDIVCINGQPTSITTSMGPTWQVWQAIREVYSNAMDATGGKFSLVDDVEPDDLQTHFYIELTGDVSAVTRNFDRYFSTQREPISEFAGVKILDNGTGSVYRKGIRCIPMSGASLFDYDLDNIGINEMRLADIDWQMGQKIWAAILTSNNPTIVDRCISNSANSDYLESALVGSWMMSLSGTSDAVSEYASSTLLAISEMTPLMSELERQQATYINNSLLSHLINTLGRENVCLPKSISAANGVNYRPVEIGAHEIAMLDSAKDRLRFCGINITYPIITAQFSSSNILALADTENKQIVVSEKLFSQGETWIVSALLEEWIHLKHDVKDMTREMQCAIFNEFATSIIRQTEATNRKVA